jgi:hypothetical protein
VNQPVCDLCATPIRGRYIKHPRAGTVCSACVAANPACARCKAPSRAEALSGTPPLCAACLGELPMCTGCSTPLTGRFFTSTAVPGAKWCEACKNKASACDFCGAPLHDGRHTYPDGRESCGACRATAVITPAALAPLESQARGWLAHRLGFALRPLAECPVHLLDAREIAAVQGKAFHATPGFDGRERGLFSAKTTTVRRGVEWVRDEHELAIYIETGLPQVEALGTVVHELVHQWQFFHYPKKPVHRQYMEGLAVWAQVHALRELGATRQAEVLAKSPDPTYGGGYRLVAEVEQAHGFEATVERLVTRIGGRWSRG